MRRSAQSQIGLNPGTVVPPAGVLDYRGGPVEMPAEGRRPVLGWALAAAPPLTALLAWPLLYLVFFVLGFTLALMTVAACLIWAWWVSGRLASWCYWKRAGAVMRGGAAGPAPGFRMCIKAILFSCQAAAIIASIPLFGLALEFSQRRGMHLGWW